MDRGVDILWVIDDQRVVAAHLESENFFRLPGKLAMKLKTRRRAAGK